VVESEKSKMYGLDKRESPNPAVKSPDKFGVYRKKQSDAKINKRKLLVEKTIKKYKVKSRKELPQEVQDRLIDLSKNISPFANFKVRRYNGFVY
jgi:hypothetical protein